MDGTLHQEEHDKSNEGLITPVEPNRQHVIQTMTSLQSCYISITQFLTLITFWIHNSKNPGGQVRDNCIFCKYALLKEMLYAAKTRFSTLSSGKKMFLKAPAENYIAECKKLKVAEKFKTSQVSQRLAFAYQHENILYVLSDKKKIHVMMTMSPRISKSQKLYIIFLLNFQFFKTISGVIPFVINHN